MPAYKYLMLYGQNDIHARSTDQTTLQWISAEARKSNPSCSVITDEHEGKVYSVLIHGLKGHQGTFILWLIDQLGAQGWEPFAIHGDIYTQYHLRLIT